MGEQYEASHTLQVRYNSVTPKVGVSLFCVGFRKQGALSHRGKADVFGNSKVDQKKSAGFVG